LLFEAKCIPQKTKVSLICDWFRADAMESK
jgi:hypothetical protein